MTSLQNIIFEGPDNTGKTSVINILSEVLAELSILGLIDNRFSKPEVHKYSGNSSLKENIKERSIAKYKHLFEEVYVNDDGGIRYFDRAHGGEVVYSKKYRGYDPSYILDLEKQYIHDHMFKSFIILLTDSAENLIKREDGGSFAKSHEEKLLELARWEEFIQVSYMPILYINLDLEKLDTLEKSVNRVFELILDIVTDDYHGGDDYSSTLEKGKHLIKEWFQK